LSRLHPKVVALSQHRLNKTIIKYMRSKGSLR